MADGQLHRLEKMMLDRVAKELKIPEADATRIKDKAFASKPL